MGNGSMRLTDLHTDWLLQYAPETTLYGPERYPRVPQRLPQAEGYLSATATAVTACFRNVEDWESRADPWGALGELITRIEAEFAGRVLRGPEDLARRELDGLGLTWAVIGVEGFDYTIRGVEDLERLPALYERGVRVFQPTYTGKSVLAGSSAEGDERGLTDLGRAFLETMAALDGPAAVDLAHMNPRAMEETLDWFEADSSRLARLVPVYSHGGLEHDGYRMSRAITMGNLTRLRALGGVIGFGVTPPFYESLDEIVAGIERAAEVPFLGRAGYEGIAIGTDFLGVDRTIEGLGNVPEVIEALMGRLERGAAEPVLHGNADRLVRRLCGAF